jgi:thymidylate synthase (FAD)
MYKQIDVLEKGYVRTLDTLGSDLTVVNAARVSFDKSVEHLGRCDISLIDYLIKNRHDSVLRHCVMSFEVYAPLFVARQWYKHTVASVHTDEQHAWNESSRRYVTEEPEFYIPSEWRSSPDNKKQGSDEPVQKHISVKHSKLLQYYAETGVYGYESAISDGICVEQARLFLPAYAMYVRWRWTTSLNALLHFISLRLDNHSQWEIQQYAKVVAHQVESHYPITYKSWEKFRVG